MVMDGKQRYCICRSTDSKSFMIACDKCEEWFHGKCIKITPDKASAIKRYYCGDCIKNDASLKIKYKKSKNKEKRKRDDEEPPSKKQKKPSKPAFSADSKCCGSCEPCKMTQDCGTCDNCKDMKKNVGVSRSKQSCRLRQCKDMSQNPDEESTVVEPVSVLESKPKPKKTQAVPKQKRTTKLSIPKVPKPRKQYTRKNQDEAKVNKSAAEITADQCLGPRCVKMSRPGSKYCSDDCGMKLAAMRLVEIMPRRVAQWQSSPCIAEQKNRRELEEIRQNILEAKQHLESLDEKHKVIDKIVELGRKEKVKEEDSDEESKTDDEEEEEDMELFVYCVTCGLEVKQRSAFKHMERCFVKIERDMSFAGSFKSMIGGDTICDHYNSSTKSYCKRLKVICAEHAKDPKIADDEICGCPLNQDVFKHTGELCKVAKKHCSDHFRWERMRRAEIDADKVRQWMKIDELFERERHTRAAMSNRAGVLSLLLHQTVDHEAIAASHHKIHTPLKSETRTPAVKSIPPTAGTAKNLSQSISTNNKAEESVASVPLTVRSISPPQKAQPTIVSNTQNTVRNASQLIRQATPPTHRPQHTVRVHNLAIRPYTTSVSPNAPATQILNSSAPKPGQKSFLSVPLTINTVHGAGAAKHPTSLSASVQLANIAKQQTAASAVTLQLNRSLSNPTHTASKTIQSIVHRSVTPTTTQPQLVQITKSGVIRAGNRTPMLQNILKAPGTTSVPRMVHPKSRMIISADKMVTTPSTRMIVGDNKAPITILTVRPGSDVIKPVISAIQQQTAAPASEHDYSTKK